MAQAATSGGKSVGAPCHAFSLLVPGEAGGLWAEPWGLVCGLSCGLMRYVGSLWLPQVPFLLPVQSHSLRCADARGLQGPWVGALTPACGPGMWTHSPERHFGMVLWAGLPPSPNPIPSWRSLRFLLTNGVLIIPLRTVCNHRAVSTPGSAKGRSRVTCAD